MATEFRIDVILDPSKAVSGAKKVDKSLKQIGSTSDNVRNSIAKLFKFAAIAYGVKQIVSLADSYTRLQNRLRVVTEGQAELASVTEKLLGVANRSRSSLQGTAELYSRMALATKDMATSQSELIGITETMNKAIILSGASAKEANNGLIQLSQGIASNRLGGDELRSVLEQLPVVADVIAKHMGITRGELRAMGATGKITGETIVTAFKNAREEIEDKFAESIPTVGQAWEVLKNNVLAYVGAADTGVGVTGRLAKAMMTLGFNIDVVVKSALSLVAVFAAMKLGPYVAMIHGGIKAHLAFNAAIKAGNVVVLGSGIARQQQAIHTLASIAADRQKIISTINATKAEMARAVVIRGSTASGYAYAAMQKQLGLLEVSLAAKTDTMTAAKLRYAAATKVANREASFFYRTLGKVRAGIRATTAAMAANPFTVLLVAVTAIIAPLILFRDQIQMSADSLSTLGDMGTVLWDRLTANLATFRKAFKDGMGSIGKAWGDVWDNMDLSIENVLLFVGVFIDTTIGLFEGSYKAIMVIWDRFPLAMEDLFIQAVNLGIGAFEFLADGIYSVFLGIINYVQNWYFWISSLFTSLGAAMGHTLAGNATAAAEEATEAWVLYKNGIASLDIGGSIEKEFDKLSDVDLLPTLSTGAEGKAADMGVAIGDAFLEGLGRTDATAWVIGLIDDTEQAANDRLAKQAQEAAKERAKGGRKDVRATEVTKLLEELRAQEQILNTQGLTNAEYAIQNNLLKIRNSLNDKKAKYTEEDIAAIEVRMRYNASLKEQMQIVNEIRGPMEDLIRKEHALTLAFLNGKLTADEFNEKLRDIEIQAAQLGNSMEDGITRGVAAVSNQLNDLAGAVSDVFVNAFQGAEDALVNFVETGEINFAEFASSIISDIARIVAKMLLLETIKGLSGIPGLGGLGGLVGMAEGGDVRANRPYIIGEKGPEIFNPSTSGTIIPNDVASAVATAPTQAPVINVPAQPTPNVTVINQFNTGSVVAAGLESPEGERALLNAISKNSDTINKGS